MKIIKSRIFAFIYVSINLVFCTSFLELKAQNDKLFPIVDNGLWGYINQEGEIKIEPMFLQASKFSEGLAAVRLRGIYGYINYHGQFELQPKYDYALSFNQGIAKVFIESKPYYIDKKGNKLFEHDYAEILGFEDNNYSVVKTKTEKLGVIDLQGNLIIDTVFLKIDPFSNEGLATVMGENQRYYPEESDSLTIIEIGVINLKGEFIVPYGKYESISEFSNGYAKVEFIKDPTIKYDYRIGMIDTTGNIKFMIPTDNWDLDYSNGYFSEGLASINIQYYDTVNANERSSSSAKNYSGVINEEGEIVFSNFSWKDVTPFKYSRAFIWDNDRNWYLIDKQGKKIIKQPYEYLLYNGYEESIFEGGIQFVKTNAGLGAIDTNGNFVFGPKIIEELNGDSFRKNNIIASINHQGYESKYPYLFGFWNYRSDIYVEPQFHNIDYEAFDDQLVQVFQDDMMGYINHKGNYIWRETKRDTQKVIKLNIDYMKRGHFTASSPYKEELAGFGGWSSSANSFQKNKANNEFNNNELSLIAVSDKNVKYLEKYSAMKLYIANTTLDTFYFDAQDSRLYLKLQAQDKYGNWNDIEYLPSSWCGNSYHSLFLPPDYHWVFVIPIFEGEYKTKLRAELLYKAHSDDKTEKTLYSNEFEGSINPGQFWRKQEYYPSGIMDPYND
jgi:WG repeat protein